MNFIQFHKELFRVNSDFSNYASNHADVQPFFFEGPSIFKPDLDKYAFLISEGVILKYHISPLGKMLYDNFYTHKSIIGLFPNIFYFDDYFEYTTLGNVSGLKIPLSTLDSYPEESKNELFFKNIQRELFWKDSAARMLGLNLQQKIYYILSIMYNFRGINPWDNTYSMPKYITHEILSTMANVSRTRVSYVMSELQKQNVITYNDDGKLVIQDIDFLHDNCGY
ncbi:Crp/Fnr family transcriptional regulator [Listeria rocourtiae]|uniref:Crp/Fnr family transcriptional regulator n=1 Tax=Listeria rocourtiae TaxID=647910 RepID=UPI003D2F91D2